MAKGIWVFAEVKDGNVRKITFELLSQGKKMAEKLGEELVAVLLGSGVEGLTGRLAEYADKVYWADDPALAQYTTDAYATVLTNLLKEHQPSIFLCGATIMGKDLSPRVATRLQTGLATDCTALVHRRQRLARGQTPGLCRKGVHRSRVPRRPAPDGLGSAQRPGDAAGGRRQEGRGRSKWKPRSSRPACAPRSWRW